MDDMSNSELTGGEQGTNWGGTFSLGEGGDVSQQMHNLCCVLMSFIMNGLCFKT